jgi:hypothetical protein
MTRRWWELIVSSGNDKGQMQRLFSQARRRVLESRCKLRWEMVSIEDRRPSLQWGGNLFFEDHFWLKHLQSNHQETK